MDSSSPPNTLTEREQGAENVLSKAPPQCSGPESIHLNNRPDEVNGQLEDETLWTRLPEVSLDTLDRVETMPLPANPSSVVNLGALMTRLPDRVRNAPMPASSSMEDIPPPKADYNAPPPYEVATQTTKLPTYEEVQREKHLEDELLGVPIVNDPSQFRAAPNQRILLPIDNEAHEDVDTSLLGTDFMFYIAFFVAFIFNWIGFLLLMCFCHTIASRYGALSGFGLSLAKWTFIVQHSTELASKDNRWLWWLIMTFGLIICIRAILQYLNIKRGWHMLSASHQERLLFFY